MDSRIRPLKRLGQNFLTNVGIQKGMIHALALCPEDLVLEIGPGKGALTDHMVQKAKHIIVVEKDRRLSEYLKKKYQMDPAIKVICEDILSYDLTLDFKKSGKIKVIGSLPYYITSQILFYLINYRFRIDRAVLLVQKEVARRIVASPGTKEFGALTVAMQYYTRTKIIRHVPAGSFWPRPGVTSSLIQVMMRPQSEERGLADEEGFFCFNKMMFSKRRKTILGSLFRHVTPHLPKQKLSAILTHCDINPQNRYEKLDLEHMILLYNGLQHQGGRHL